MVITGLLRGRGGRLVKIAETVLYGYKKPSLVGDGEFDGADLLAWFQAETDWQFVCRTSSTTLVYYQNKWLSLTEIVAELALAPGETAFLAQVAFIRSHPLEKLNIFIPCRQHYGVWTLHRKQITGGYFFRNILDSIAPGGAIDKSIDQTLIHLIPGVIGKADKTLLNQYAIGEAESHSVYIEGSPLPTTIQTPIYTRKIPDI